MRRRMPVIFLLGIAHRQTAVLDLDHLGVLPARIEYRTAAGTMLYRRTKAWHGQRTVYEPCRVQDRSRLPRPAAPPPPPATPGERV